MITLTGKHLSKEYNSRSAQFPSIIHIWTSAKDRWQDYGLSETNQKLQTNFGWLGFFWIYLKYVINKLFVQKITMQTVTVVTTKKKISSQPLLYYRRPFCIKAGILISR